MSIENININSDFSQVNNATQTQRVKHKIFNKKNLFILLIYLQLSEKQNKKIKDKKMFFIGKYAQPTTKARKINLYTYNLSIIDYI